MKYNYRTAHLSSLLAKFKKQVYLYFARKKKSIGITHLFSVGALFPVVVASQYFLLLGTFFKTSAQALGNVRRFQRTVVGRGVWGVEGVGGVAGLQTPTGGGGGMCAHKLPTALLYCPQEYIYIITKLT